MQQNKNLNSAMETGDHSKNGASLKSLISRGNSFNIKSAFFIVLATALLFNFGAVAQSITNDKIVMIADQYQGNGEAMVISKTYLNGKVNLPLQLNQMIRFTIEGFTDKSMDEFNILIVDEDPSVAWWGPFTEYVNLGKNVPANTPFAYAVYVPIVYMTQTSYANGTFGASLHPAAPSLEFHAKKAGLISGSNEAITVTLTKFEIEDIGVINSYNFFDMDFSTCSHSLTTILLNTYNTIKWQRSDDNELSWTDIACTSSYYVEIAPAVGTYIYRALNGDGTWSNYVKANYFDTVPSSINVLPLAMTDKKVDGNITFSLELTGNDYNYQWYKGSSAINGATSSNYSIPAIKMSDAGTYHCRISNGCNGVTSSNTMLTVDKTTQQITLPATMSKAAGDADFELPAVTDKNLTISYSSSNTDVATVTGNWVHIVGVGSATITASQAGNNDYIAALPVTLLLTVSKGQQSIIFNALPEKTYGDPAFALSASVNSGRTITYESSNTNVATVSGNTLIIHNAGTATIVAFVAGDNDYDAASPVQQQLTVNKRPLHATPTNAVREYGNTNPAFTVSYTGFANGDIVSSLTIPPVATTTASATSAVGNYEITCSGGNAVNYSFTYATAILSITKAPLIITANKVTRIQGQRNPVFTLSYSGFKNGENQSVLNYLPLATCYANESSTAGNYEIFLSGGNDDNYSYTLVNGTLTVSASMDIEELTDMSNITVPKEAGIAIIPEDVSAKVAWRAMEEATGYTLVIYGSNHTDVICSLEFDALGRLQSITFGQLKGGDTEQDVFGIRITNLSENTTYHYKMQTLGAGDTVLDTKEGTFKTTGEGTGTGVVGALHATPLPGIIGYYNLLGQKLPQEPEKGIYIILYDNGKSEKIVKYKE